MRYFVIRFLNSEINNKQSLFKNKIYINHFSIFKFLILLILLEHFKIEISA